MRRLTGQASELLDDVLENPTAGLVELQREIVLAESKSELAQAVEQFKSLTAHEVNKRGINVH